MTTLLASAARILAIIALVYVVILLLYTLFQRNLIYYPQTASETSLVAQAKAYGLEPWRNSSGDLIGWIGRSEFDTSQPTRRVLVFHGNAGNAVVRDYFVSLFNQGEFNWQVYLLEYPGYGARSGRPSEKAFVTAALEGFDLLQTDNEGPIFLLGESLGSGIATQLAAERSDHVAGLLLITPFTRLADVGRHHFPWLPINTLLRDRYDSKAALHHYHGPVAIVTAEHDTIVPAKFGRELYEHYAGPKIYIQLEGRGHNNIGYHPRDPIWSEVVHFLVGKQEG